MPNFLNPFHAAAAAAIALPLLLLLYFLKLRRQEMLVSSTLLWKKSIQDLQVNAPFQRLRKNLLLFLQLFLLLLLILALARPVVNHWQKAGKLTVVMIDRSASMAATDMAGKSRLDEAKRQAKELIDTLDNDASAMVIAFDDSADIVRSFTNDRALLKQTIDAIQPTDRQSRLKLAFQLAEAKAMAFYSDALRPDGTRPEIWLYSDGRTLDRQELALRNSDLKYTRLGSDEAANVALVSLSAKRNYERPAEVQVFARLANFGPQPVSAVLQLSVDGTVVPGGVKRNLTLLPERWTAEQRDKAEKEQKLIARDSAEFTLDLTRGAVIRVALKELENDLLAADDSAQIVVPPPRSLNVLLVSSNGNFWLEKFLQSANLKDPGIISAEEFEEKMKDPQAVASKYDLIIFDRVDPKALPPVGNFIYFRATPPDSRLKAARDENGPLMLKDQTVMDWDRDHPMLRNWNLKFYVKEMLKLELPPDAKVLAESDEAPMIVHFREGRSTHLAFSFDVQESTWPYRRNFPVILDNALQFLALGAEMDLRQAYLPGATPRIPRYNLQQAGANLKQLKLHGPGGALTVNVPEAGDFALPPLEKVGLYTLEPPIPQYERLAVNLLDEGESNLMPVPEIPGGVGQSIAASAGKSRLELWRWILAAAFPLCLLEWWVYTRRMHL